MNFKRLITPEKCHLHWIWPLYTSTFSRCLCIRPKTAWPCKSVIVSWICSFWKRSKPRKSNSLFPRLRRFLGSHSSSVKTLTSSWLLILRLTCMISLWVSRGPKWLRPFPIVLQKDTLSYFTILSPILPASVILKRALCNLISWICIRVGIIRASLFNWTLIYSNKVPKIARLFRAPLIKAAWPRRQLNLAVRCHPRRRAVLPRPRLVRGPWVTSRAQLRLSPTYRSLPGLTIRISKCSALKQRRATSKMEQHQVQQAFHAVWTTRRTSTNCSWRAFTTRLLCFIFHQQLVRSKSMSLIHSWRSNTARASQYHVKASTRSR